MCVCMYNRCPPWPHAADNVCEREREGERDRVRASERESERERASESEREKEGKWLQVQHADERAQFSFVCYGVSFSVKTSLSLSFRSAAPRTGAENWQWEIVLLRLVSSDSYTYVVTCNHVYIYIHSTAHHVVSCCCLSLAGGRRAGVSAKRAVCLGRERSCRLYC